MSDPIDFFEISALDSLQNEPREISTPDKLRLINLLSDCGFARIEVTSFVSPKWLPQIADVAKGMAAIRRAPGARYAA